MSKLEIGSMVRVKDNYYVTDLVGKIGEVVSYLANGELVTVQFKGMEGHPELHDGNCYSDSNLDRKRNKRYISPKNLELVEKENKQMTKKDLKSGMTVKLRNGDVYLVVEDFLSNQNRFNNLENYTNDLKNQALKYLDITEVYQYKNSIYGNSSQNLTTLLDLTNPNMQLLWKRQELPKLSSAERVILENLDKKYKWIARDESEKLFVFCRKHNNNTSFWISTDEIDTELVFPNLFKFVKWEDEQPYSIEELLKGEW